MGSFSCLTESKNDLLKNGAPPTVRKFLSDHVEWPLYSKVVMLLVSTPSGQFNLSVVLPLPPKVLSALSTQLKTSFTGPVLKGNKRQIYNLYSDPQDRVQPGLSKLAHKVGTGLLLWSRHHHGNTPHSGARRWQ